MIRLIVFDLDGVLVDAKEIHYMAFNKALEKLDPKYVISRQEHLSLFDGLPTTKKLEILTARKGLSSEYYSQIWTLKQEMTLEVINQTLRVDDRLRSVLKSLKNDGYLVYVASNSIRESIRLMLEKTGLIGFVDKFFSNEDVSNPKPHTEIYLKCMVDAKVNPHECLIVEDSPKGRAAAHLSGGNVCAVNSVQEVTYERINNHINNARIPVVKWQQKEMNILIPMAGAGSRFASVGYKLPKPLIDVRGKPMIQMVVDNINIDANYIFVVQKEHYDKYNLQTALNLIAPGCKIVQVDRLTEGAACTTLLAKNLIDNEHPLLLANSDQFVEWNSSDFMYSIVGHGLDGGILTFRATHPKWSFVKLNESGYVCEVAEKHPISDIANVGIYYWKHGSDYVKYAEKMIEKNIRVNNEFYVSCVYNEAILDNKKIRNYDVERMWGTGTPEDLEYFLQNYQGEV